MNGDRRLDAGDHDSADLDPVAADGGADRSAPQRVRVVGLEVEDVGGGLRAHQGADGIEAGRLADLVEVGRGDGEDELLGRRDREGQEQVEVDADVVAATGIAAPIALERDLAHRDDV